MKQSKQFHANPDGFYNPWEGIPKPFLSSLGNSERNMNDMSANAFHGTGPPTARFIQPAHAFHGQGPPAPRRGLSRRQDHQAKLAAHPIIQRRHGVPRRLGGRLPERPAAKVRESILEHL